MQTNFTSLSKFLQQTKIPEVHEKFGFLELIKKQTNETINSQIYAHFLDSNVPEIKNAFMDGLMSILIERVDKNLALVEPFTYTEVYTSSKKRIDIVIEDFHSQSAIIIENKINHEVNNPFKEYWDHYDKFSEDNRIGVLLTIHPETIPVEVKDFFVNITHKEWIDNVKSTLELFNLDLWNQVYLSDFFNTIDNLTKSYAMNESAMFYFQNAQKVLQATETRNQAVIFINNQLQIVSSELKLDMNGNNLDWRNFWDSQNGINTYLTVITEKLMLGRNNIMIILELFNDDVKTLPNLDQHLKNHPQYQTKMKGEVKSNKFAHYLTQNYELTQDELASLGETIVNYIRLDFADILIEAIKLNHPNKDISHWENHLLSV